MTAPRIAGTPHKGEQLTCRTGEWVGSPAQVEVQWLRGAATVVSRTRATYVVVGADVGHMLRCLVTASNEAGSTTASSPAVNTRRIPVSFEHETRPIQTGPTLRFAGRVRTQRPASAGIVDVLRDGVRIAWVAPGLYGGFRLAAPLYGLLPGRYDFVLRFTPTDRQQHESTQERLRVAVETPSTYPFPRSPFERRPTLFDQLPRFWSDGFACSVGCRPAAARPGWPLKPFDQQHPLRAGINELRDSGFHLGVDIQARGYSPVYAIEPGRVRILQASGEGARVQVGSFIYWHLKILVRDGEYVSAYAKPLGIILRFTRHLHLSEVDATGRYLNPLRPGGRVLEPWEDREPPVIGQPEFHADGSVTVAAFDPQSFVARTSYETPVLAPSALAWRLYLADGRPLAPLKWVFRGSHVLPDELIPSVFTPSAHRPGYLCFALREICVPDWEYRLAASRAQLGDPKGRPHRLTIYAWDWFGNVTARDVWLANRDASSEDPASGAHTSINTLGSRTALARHVAGRD
ncbi:MAG: M23 family metallopeptidase [Gaiella sp.]